MHSPPLVLADEPTASLDSANGQAVAGALLSLARERGVAMLVATHDSRFRALGCRSLRLVDGAVARS